MESTAWPEWDQTAWNWGEYSYPGYEYYPPEEGGYAGWGPISRYNPYQPYPEQPGELLLYLKGCALSGPSIITDCTKEYKYSFSFLAGNVVNVLVAGDADLISPKFSYKSIPKAVMGLSTAPDPEIFGATRLAPDEEKSHYAKEWYDEHLVGEYDKYPPDIIIKPFENAEYGSEIRIKVYVKLIQNDMLYDGWCEKTIKVFCGCRDAVPEIYATGDAVTMDASDSLNMWVNSLDYPDIYAVPPFQWSLSGGSGFSLSKYITNDEYEVNVLSTDASPVGTATVTVIDACNVSDTYDVAYDCCGLGLTPAISGTTTEVRQGSSITLASTAACSPYTWTIDQTVEADGDGFSIDQSGTSCTLKASATACGGVVVTVTDDCGKSDTYRVRCPDGGAWSWPETRIAGCGGTIPEEVTVIIADERYRITYYGGGTDPWDTEICGLGDTGVGGANRCTYDCLGDDIFEEWYVEAGFVCHGDNGASSCFIYRAGTNFPRKDISNVYLSTWECP